MLKWLVECGWHSRGLLFKHLLLKQFRAGSTFNLSSEMERSKPDFSDLPHELQAHIFSFTSNIRQLKRYIAYSGQLATTQLKLPLQIFFGLPEFSE